MPTLCLELPHRCCQERAIRCIDKWLTALSQEHGQWIERTSVTWNGGSADFLLELHALGTVSVSGTLKVDAERFSLRGELPWRAAVFKRKIESVMCEALTAKCRDCPDRESNEKPEAQNTGPAWA